MSLFDSVVAAPADPILGLTDAFKADSRSDKINLGVGVFVDQDGATPVLASVRQAEERLVRETVTKSYLPIIGSPAYTRLTQELAFGDSLAASLADCIVTAHTPGGTGALRIAADFIAHNLGKPAVWISTPTWANHGAIFAAAGLTVQGYPYFEAARNGINFETMRDALRRIPAGDVVLLHACCHNPTGADLSPKQWQEVVAIAQERSWIPLLDFAYQGFGDGLDSDAIGVRQCAEAGVPCFVAHSFSKNFGLYQERVGALHIRTESKNAAERVASQVKVVIRTNYSNPPAHGGAVVATILGDAELRTLWMNEVEGMRRRINGVREVFVAALAAEGVRRDFGFLRQQRGMFSFTGLTTEQVRVLRERHAIYMVDSGRINVAGITTSNLPRLVAAIKAVIG